ncbi:MAG: IS30 family transposase [Candidatus Pacebacteria bacterium]|nr:IS30 family transposase [Candidatus Paceibacterota bacterium]
MYTHITFEEREQIGLLRAAYWKPVDIARELGRDPKTIRRELKRSKPWCNGYVPSKAHHDARKKKKIPRTPKKLDHAPLWKLVQKKLRTRWSPEQIAVWLKRTYAETHMQVSHESIYTYIYALPRGALRKELISYLRKGSRGRQRRHQTRDNRGKLPNMVSIHERPKETEDRTVPGHWESDLIVGKDHKSAIATLVERTTRMTILVPLKEKTAPAVRKALAKEVKHLPKEAFRSITHDRGSEMAEHELFTKETRVQVYFADPQSPWQRGTNENTNGLIRQYFPKGTDFRQVPTRYLKQVQKQLNARPRKAIGFKTPEEAFALLLGKRAVKV